MFDNILNQSATSLLKEDIRRGRFPGSVLFSGPASSGKLSCALETARVLSCEKGGAWDCGCRSCMQHKAMVSQNVLVVGAGNRTLEIAAAKMTLLSQSLQNTRHLEAARFLYLRAVRKLTVRFSPVLWEGEDKLSKFAPLLQAVDENLELLQPGRVIPDGDRLEKILDEVEKNCGKLESSFLYDSVPVSQIRNCSAWAHLKAGGGRKVLIIENADLMAESARNALLKILEEPPEDVVFILTTKRKSSLLPTILSRVRTYAFFERTPEQQKNVISRVFHYEAALHSGAEYESITGFLQSFLKVKPEAVKLCALEFFKSVAGGRVPDIPQTVSSCASFEPRVLFDIFIQGFIEALDGLKHSAADAESSFQVLQLLKKALSSVTVFNQSPASCLEELARSVMQVQYCNSGIFRSAVNE